MSLSVCLITADPAWRIATILEPLRPLADEIVIAADSRVDEETLAGYAAVADKLFRVEYRMAERHFAWLCTQCEGDWILRMDGDEVPSQAFLRNLPGMVRSREVSQFWTPVAWLYPDREHLLAGPPWSEDFHIRLIRNHGLQRASGVQHHHMAPAHGTLEYLEEPFYHLDLLISGREQRRDKAIRYEVARPRLQAVGGGRINEAFYMPESHPSLELAPVAAEDLPRIARALEPPSGHTSTAMGFGPAEPATALRHSSGPSDAGLAAAVTLVSLAEMDSVWEGRDVPESAYRASIDPRQPASTLTVGEQRQLFFYVTNRGSERWPANLEEHPLIRLGYRWLHPDGSVHIEEGPRSPFPRRVSPGERILTPLHVDAPPEPGEYVLEVDVVHEHVRWFGCACRIPVCVQGDQDIRASRMQLCESPSYRPSRARRVAIPRVFHRVWLGEDPMPPAFERYGKTFADHHPDWEMRLWSEEDLEALDITETERKQARTPAELSNLVRYEVLHRFGGVYVDTDFQCLRPLTPLLRGVDAFAALERPGRAAVGILGSVPGHTIFQRAARLTRQTLSLGDHSDDANGPYMLSLLLEQDPSVTIFAARLFYPYSRDRPERRHDPFPDAYAVHHWGASR